MRPRAPPSPRFVRVSRIYPVPPEPLPQNLDLNGTHFDTYLPLLCESSTVPSQNSVLLQLAEVAEHHLGSFRAGRSFLSHSPLLRGVGCWRPLENRQFYTVAFSHEGSSVATLSTKHKNAVRCRQVVCVCQGTRTKRRTSEILSPQPTRKRLTA